MESRRVARREICNTVYVEILHAEDTLKDDNILISEKRIKDVAVIDCKSGGEALARKLALYGRTKRATAIAS